jgi:hypothetical protein
MHTNISTNVTSKQVPLYEGNITTPVIWVRDNVGRVAHHVATNYKQQPTLVNTKVLACCFNTSLDEIAMKISKVLQVPTKYVGIGEEEIKKFQPFLLPRIGLFKFQVEFPCNYTLPDPLLPGIEFPSFEEFVKSVIVPWYNSNK